MHLEIEFTPPDGVKRVYRVSGDDAAVDVSKFVDFGADAMKLYVDTLFNNQKDKTP